MPCTAIAHASCAIDHTRGVFNSHYSKRWPNCGSVAPERSSSINRISLVINFLQAAAAAYVLGQPDILTAAQNGDVALVFFHLVVNADDVNKRDDW